MLNKIIEVSETLDWTIVDDGYTVTFSRYSPAGEDFSFAVDKENIIEEVKKYSAYFDIDEHIEMWIEAKRNGVSGIPSTRELVYDAEDIDDMLKELAAALSNITEMEV